ncbi:MAG TPA: hypothetical protein VN808_09180 [Stellaceae bacterium]|nr:hypothetical protein [Stellaceae bacterium]
MANVVICCSAPSGIILALSDGRSVTLSGPPAPDDGLNRGVIRAGFTTIDADFWATWSSGPGRELVASGAVWEVV